MNFFFFYISLLLLLAEESNQQCYSGVKFKSIPPNHLYNKLKKPLVIGYLGNIIRFQENSLEGMINLIQINADGMHMQVQLTKDNQLILFGDDNFYRLTKEDFLVENLPYSEIVKMNIQKEIEYKLSDSTTVKKIYGSTVKVPLLSAVLNSIKGNNKLIYIELVPNHIPPQNPLDRHRAVEVAKLVGDLVKQLQLENDVFIVSKDPFKIYALSYYHPQLQFGWWPDVKMFDNITAYKMKEEYNDIPVIYESNCFDGTENGFLFAKYLLTSGMLAKSINSTFIDLPLEIYSNMTYFSNKITETNIVPILQSSYGQGTSIGLFGVFSDKSALYSPEDDFKFIRSITDNGLTRFITNDVNRVKIALQRIVLESSSISLNSLRWPILLSLFISFLF
ncbi:uncharacterized protein LOC100208300 isoform X2 [Hydra vulgaris]|uniref:Uncharacterized protein LOC100208300 isoform X2 n=1 Tax=Hydra vulgaris TaxID=6087 RepID=A0ABM4D6A6_HYDVU